MGSDVGWQHGEDHMQTGHQITVQAANEALADPEALLSDPDPQEHVRPERPRDRLLADRGRGPGGHPHPARGQARIMAGRQRLARE